MLKKLFFISVFAALTIIAKAQTAEDTYNAYVDFNLSYAQHQNEKALTQGEKLLPNADKLTDKLRPNFYYLMGTLYEDTRQTDKAVIYYNKVVTAVPNYYIAHRALGYLYLGEANKIAGQLNAAKADIAENKRLAALYKVTAQKAIPHLEKAQACEPDNDTLTRIKMLYKNTHDEQGLNSINTRLESLSKNCVDMLGDK